MKSSFFRAISDMLFPPKCAFCRTVLKRGEKDICGKCLKELPFTEGGEAEQTGEFFDRCVSPLFYEDRVRDSLLRYKFEGKVNYARAYAGLMSDCIRKHFAGQYDLITWVPLSRKREKKRGYDQAMLLAMALAVELEDVAVETLRKIEDNPAQSGIQDRDKRAANVIGAYEVRDPELLQQRRVLLVDDIITTGATLSECARMLRMAGAEHVFCATVARGRPHIT